MTLDEYALVVNAHLAELDLYPAVSVQSTTDTTGVPYLLLFLGGAPSVHGAPETLALLAATFPDQMTAPDVWNAFAPYRQDATLVHEATPGVWALGCGHCPRRRHRPRDCPFTA